MSSTIGSLLVMLSAAMWGGKSVTGGIKIEKTGCFDLEKAELVSNDSVHGNCFGQLRPVCLCIRDGKPRRPDPAGR